MWPINFKGNFLRNTQHLFWNVFEENKPSPKAPVLLKFLLKLPPSQEKYKDTFIKLDDFEKGIIIVNGFNIGRYWNSVGPQKTLLVPGGLLKARENYILVFEELLIGSKIVLQTEQKFN